MKKIIDLIDTREKELIKKREHYENHVVHHMRSGNLIKENDLKEAEAIRIRIDELHLLQREINQL